jgi:hypothetical protein
MASSRMLRDLAIQPYRVRDRPLQIALRQGVSFVSGRDIPHGTITSSMRNHLPRAALWLTFE